MRTLTRRQLGLGLGASLIAAPFVELLGRPARADNTKVATRLVIFFSPNGTVPAHWTPSGSDTSYSFPAGSILEPLGMTTTDPALGPLASIKDDIIVCGGLDFFNTSNHVGGMTAMLTANGDTTSVSGGLSVDQYVASSIGKGTKFKSLEFGVQTSLTSADAQSRMVYSAPGKFVPPEDDPFAAYSRMFGDVLAGPQAAAVLLKKRKSVLDLASSELTALRGRVGAEEQAKLDAHLDALRQVEQSLSAPVGCSATAAPAGIDYAANANFPSIGKEQMDLLVTALSCGMTNVASIQWSQTVGQTQFAWKQIGDGHHSLSHSDDSNTSGVANFVTCERWFAAQFSYFVNQLKKASLLDSTLVVWTKELGDSRQHVCTGVPFVIAGNAGGRFKTGRYIDFKGEFHGRLLVSICQAMGINIDTFGGPGSGTGALTELEG